MNSNHREDWREPLYEYANKKMEKETVPVLTDALEAFSFLGDYRDSAALYSKCAEKRRQLEESLPAEGKNACRKLSEPAGVSRRSSAAGTLRRILPAGVIMILVLAAAIFFGWQRHVLHTARTNEAEGAYEVSLKKYWGLLLGPYYREASEKIPKLQRALAYSFIEKKQFQDAIDLFVEQGDADGEKDSHNAWGNDLTEQGEYEAAAAQFEQAENPEKKQETYLAWSDAEASNGKIQEAIEVLLLAEASDESKGRLADLRSRRCEEAVQKLCSTVQTADADAESEAGMSARHTSQEITRVADIGAELDDLDSILAYCRALAECGYDPGAIYPEGVEVLDVPTGSYQLPEDVKTASAKQKSADLTAGKGLIFTREQMIPDDPKEYLCRSWDSTEGLPWDPADESLYRLKLQVAELYQLPEEKRAENLESCSWIYLADTVYGRSTTAYMESTFSYRMNGRMTTLKKEYYYPILYAADSGVFYEWGNPERCEVTGYHRTMPELQLLLNYSGMIIPPLISVPCDPEKLTAEEITEMFYGKPDPEFKKMMLKKGVDTAIAG